MRLKFQVSYIIILARTKIVRLSVNFYIFPIHSGLLRHHQETNGFIHNQEEVGHRPIQRSLGGTRTTCIGVI